MIGRWTQAQERGLLLLLAAGLLVGGLTLNLPRARFGQSTPYAEPDRIVLSPVTVVLPVYVEPWPVDVNTAGVDELVRLNGIGPALAARIIEYREEHGPFSSLDHLTRVQGIGSHTLAGLQDQATTIQAASSP